MNEERNYHIFYRMLAGAPNDMKQALGIDPHQNYAVSFKYRMNIVNTYVHIYLSMDRDSLLATFSRWQPS